MKNLSVGSMQDRLPELEGPIRLWASVMRVAAADLESGEFRPKALAWFASPSDQVGSFRWCCDVLGLDAEAVLEAVTSGSTVDLRRRYAGLIRLYSLGRDEPKATPKKDTGWL